MYRGWGSKITLFCHLNWYFRFVVKCWLEMALNSSNNLKIFNVFYFQCGFAFLEAGSVRWDRFLSFGDGTPRSVLVNSKSSCVESHKITIVNQFFSCRTKNTVNILLKNLLDLFFGAMSYRAIGLSTNCYNLSLFFGYCYCYF